MIENASGLYLIFLFLWYGLIKLTHFPEQINKEKTRMLFLEKKEDSSGRIHMEFQ